MGKKFNFYRKSGVVKKQSWVEWMFGETVEMPKIKKEEATISNRLKESIQLLSEIFDVEIPEVKIIEAEEVSPGKLNNKLGNRLENQFNDSVDDFAEFDLD